MRVPAISPIPGTSAIADAMRIRRGERGLTPLDTALLNAPEIALGWNTLLGAIRTKNSLPADIRELMILRVAARNSAAFEWHHHDHVGVAAGLTGPQLTVIRDLYTPLPLPSSPAPLTAIQAAALRFADASTFSVNVPQSRVNELKEYLKNDQQYLEAAAVVATYNMVSRLLISVDVGDMKSESVALPEMIETEHDIEVEVGIKLHVRVAKRAIEGENAPWLVFVNSLMTNQKMWEGCLPRLSKKYNLLTFDQRGHGKSSVPKEPATLDILASDIATILSKLSIPTPIHAIIGVSQGGATTLAFAHNHPTLYSRMITCDTQATAPLANNKAWEDRIEFARKEGMNSLAKITLPRWFPSGSDLLEGGRREAFVYDMINDTTVEGFVVGARALQNYNVLPNLSNVLKDKKILLMVGERDGVLPVTLKNLADQLVGEGVDCGYVVIPGAGHLPMLDATTLWLDEVEKFLN